MFGQALHWTFWPSLADKTIHPFIERNWRKATKGAIQVSRKCARSARRSMTSAMGGARFFESV
jgi:hypothetical protein